MISGIISEFSKLDISGQIIFGILLISFVIITYIFLKWAIIRIVGKSHNGILKIGPITIGKEREHKDKSKDKNNEEIRHSTCPKVKDVIHILQLQGKVLYKIFYIKSEGILQEQLAFAEAKLDILVNKAESIIRDLLEVVNTEYMYSKEYVTFKAVAELIKGNVVDKLRIMCKQNHLAEKTPEEFKDYTKTQIALIMSLIKNNEMAFYPYRNSIPYYEKMKEMCYVIEETLSEIIYKSQEIAIQKQKEINELENEFETRYFEIIGER